VAEGVASTFLEECEECGVGSVSALGKWAGWGLGSVAMGTGKEDTGEAAGSIGTYDAWDFSLERATCGI